VNMTTELEAEYRQLQNEVSDARREGLGNLADRLETRMEYIDAALNAERSRLANPAICPRR